MVGVGPVHAEERRGSQGSYRYKFHFHESFSVLLSSFAGRWTASRGVRLHLEVRTGNERRDQILRIIDDTGDDEIRIAVRFIHTRKVLGEDRVAADRNAVFPQIPGTHVRRFHFQIPSAWGSSAVAQELPFGG